jgi:hypothetical protein
MSNRRNRTGVVLTAAAALAGVLVPGVSAAQNTAAAPIYEAAGTSYSPSGASATNWWHLPTLATAKVGAATRLFRGAMTSGTDDGNNISFENQYLDLGSGAGWQPIKNYPVAPGQPAGFEAKGQLANFENFVADGSTLHTFDETTERPDPSGNFRVRHRVSADGGVTWQTSSSTIDPSGTQVAPGGQLILHGGIEVLPSGDWVMPLYTRRCLGNKPCDGKDATSYKMAIGLLASSNKGQSWTKPALPFVSAENHYTESTMVRRADGKLLMVGRYDPDFPASAFLGLLVFRVSDRKVDSAADLVGMTWSAPHSTVPGVKQVGGLTMGVSPRLTKVGDRIMLTFGRPGNTVAWSTDGLGTSWTDSHSLNPNRPTACDESAVHKNVKIADLPCDAMGSSGYMRTAVTDQAAGVGYIVGDRCHVWSCEIPGQVSWPDVTWPNQAESATQAVWLVRFTAP